uniref:Septal ring factor EnvC, activator of murein hydrolases AmiA and AmiB n=1 Tax=Candidatus Kentrum sp. DK TaxID=2126562 RepID=A0A450T809_9GAMM|nr:MAG: Septal ring factor EnvC, activator of murein hydrolases AmiA and AmiB [Candidatus Kentron sp. DK]
MASKCSATKCKPHFLDHFCLVMKHNSSFAVASCVKNLIAFFLCILLGTLAVGASSSTTREEAEAELGALQKIIRAVSARLGHARSKRDIAQEKLRDAEVAIGRMTKEFRKVENQLEAQKRQLEKLRHERDRQTKALVMQRDDLARRIRLSYAMGRQDYVKLFLNQENPSNLARMMTYYRYFNQARADRIEATRLHLARIEALEEEIDKETASLMTLRDTKKKAKDNLKRLADRRKTVVMEFAREIDRGDQRLTRLQQNKARLERLITDIRQKSKPYGYHKPFRQLRGHLRWPTVGVILNDFGTKRGLGGLTWQGVMIAAKAGRPVRGIAHGQVIFSDWLRGFGLLLIVDHGDGYMSLYGHNKGLYKQEGDKVDPGEVIASVGNSGGKAEDALYFEIRHGGLPQDPAIWCK